MLTSEHNIWRLASRQADIDSILCQDKVCCLALAQQQKPTFHQWTNKKVSENKGLQELLERKENNRILLYFDLNLLWPWYKPENGNNKRSHTWSDGFELFRDRRGTGSGLVDWC